MASPSTPTATRTAKPELAPDEAIKRAETKEAPSIDLEIFFDYKSAEVTAKAVAVLDTLGRALSDARLADDSFLIAGHTDAKGGAAYNLELSQRRAESVRQFLIANFKVEPGRLIAKGYGFQHLQDPERSPRRRQPPRADRQPVQGPALTVSYRGLSPVSSHPQSPEQAAR